MFGRVFCKQLNMLVTERFGHYVQCYHVERLTTSIRVHFICVLNESTFKK